MTYTDRTHNRLLHVLSLHHVSRYSHCTTSALNSTPIPSRYLSILPLLHHSFFINPPTPSHYFFFFFLNDPAPPEIYPLPLHDAFPIYRSPVCPTIGRCSVPSPGGSPDIGSGARPSSVASWPRWARPCAPPRPRP